MNSQPKLKNWMFSSRISKNLFHIFKRPKNDSLTRVYGSFSWWIWYGICTYVHSGILVKGFQTDYLIIYLQMSTSNLLFHGFFCKDSFFFFHTSQWRWSYEEMITKPLHSRISLAKYERNQRHIWFWWHHSCRLSKSDWRISLSFIVSNAFRTYRGITENLNI